MRFLAWLRCKHEHIRCVHGDEIIARNWRRAACLDCDRSLDIFPRVCFYTGETHESLRGIA